VFSRRSWPKTAAAHVLAMYAGAFCLREARRLLTAYSGRCANPEPALLDYRIHEIEGIRCTDSGYVVPARTGH
jgi:hypothetical protein